MITIPLGRLTEEDAFNLRRVKNNCLEQQTWCVTPESKIRDILAYIVLEIKGEEKDNRVPLKLKINAFGD